MHAGAQGMCALGSALCCKLCCKLCAAVLPGGVACLWPSDVHEAGQQWPAGVSTAPWALCRSGEVAAANVPVAATSLATCRRCG